jgi:hypothetical protein
MAKSPAWTRKEGKRPQGRVECQGPCVSQEAGDEPQTSGTQAEDREGRLPPQEFLCQNVRHEEEAHQREDQARPEQPHQQEPQGVELLT